MSGFSSGFGADVARKPVQPGQGELFDADESESASSVVVAPQFAGRALQTLKQLRGGYFTGKGRLEGRTWRCVDFEGLDDRWEDTGTVTAAGDRLYAQVRQVKPEKQEWVF